MNKLTRKIQNLFRFMLRNNSMDSFVKYRLLRLKRKNERLSDYQKYEVLKEAKKVYKNLLSKQTYVGMCFCISQAILDMGYSDTPIAYDHLKLYIPKFNKKFLTEKFLKGSTRGYWWDYHDSKSRLEAFDKLIKYYH